MHDEEVRSIIATVLDEFPDTQGIYLFGSALTGAREDAGDIDIAVLLPPTTAKETGSFVFSDLVQDLTVACGRAVDLVNLRLVSTVFRFEIVKTGRSLFVGDRYAVDEFEMLTISFYQRLNEERRDILDQVFRTSRTVRL